MIRRLPLLLLLLPALALGQGDDWTSILRKPTPACSEGAVSAQCKCGGVKVASGYCYGGVPSAAACYASSATVTEWGVPVIDYRPATSDACTANQTRVLGGAITVAGSAGINWTWNARYLQAGLTSASGGVVVPTVTAGRTDSTGGTTAIRLDFPAMDANQRSSWYDNPLRTARVIGTPLVWSCYVRGVAGVTDSGTAWLGIAVGAGTPAYTSCAIDSTSWTRCSHAVTNAAGAAYSQPYIGPDTNAGRGQTSPQAAASYDVERCQLEMGPAVASTYAEPGASTYDTIALRAVDIVGTDTAMGAVTWVPTAAAAGFSADQPLLWSTSFRLVYRAATRVVEFATGGQVVSSAAQTFSAGADVVISYTYTVGSPACVTVGGAQTCSAGNTTAPATLPLVFVGNPYNWAQSTTLKTASFSRGTAQTWSIDDTKVSALGNSITLGAQCTTAYPALLGTQLGAGFVVYNDGKSGYEGIEAVEWWNANRATGVTGIVIILFGTNELLHQQSAEESMRWITIMAEEVLAKGGHPVLVTVLPWGGYAGWTAAQEVQRVRLNAMIAAYATLRGIPLVDAAGDMSEGSPLALKAAYAHTDKLHLASAGCTRLYQLVYAGGQAASLWP